MNTCRLWNRIASNRIVHDSFLMELYRCIHQDWHLLCSPPPSVFFSRGAMASPTASAQLVGILLEVAAYSKYSAGYNVQQQINGFHVTGVYVTLIPRAYMGLRSKGSHGSLKKYLYFTLFASLSVNTLVRWELNANKPILTMRAACLTRCWSRYLRFHDSHKYGRVCGVIFESSKHSYLCIEVGLRDDNLRISRYSYCKPLHMSVCNRIASFRFF